MYGPDVLDRFDRLDLYSTLAMPARRTRLCESPLHRDLTGRIDSHIAHVQVATSICERIIQQFSDVILRQVIFMCFPLKLATLVTFESLGFFAGNLKEHAQCRDIFCCTGNHNDNDPVPHPTDLPSPRHATCFKAQRTPSGPTLA